jgi:hypothetical protein
MVSGEYADEPIVEDWRQDETLATRQFAYLTAVSDGLLETISSVAFVNAIERSDLTTIAMDVRGRCAVAVLMMDEV